MQSYTSLSLLTNGVSTAYSPLLANCWFTSKTNSKLIRFVFTAAWLFLGFGVAQRTLHAQDIGAQVNSEFKACNYACTVQIPSGTYQQSTTINFPCVSVGTAMLIGAGPSTVLNYTGSGDSIAALCTGQPMENFIVKDLKVTLTSSARSGIHMSGFNGGLIENVSVSGGTNADGILNQGANAVTIQNSNFYSNANGIHNISIQNYSPNAIHVIGGQIFSNSNCGVYEQGSSFGRQIGNLYQGITFQYNGTNNVATSGQMCLESYANLTVRDNYFEYSCSQTVPYTIWAGDSAYQPGTGLFEGNAFLSCGATASINLANSFATTFISNGESGAIACFITQGSSTWDTTSMANYALAVKAFACGNTNINYVSTSTN